jgi:hypothetical protein
LLKDSEVKLEGKKKRKKIHIIFKACPPLQLQTAGALERGIDPIEEKKFRVH